LAVRIIKAIIQIYYFDCLPLWPLGADGCRSAGASFWIFNFLTQAFRVRLANPIMINPAI
jgi:hypothetical protein